MLHGSSIDIDAVPTEADLKEADAKAGPNTLMQMTYANFHGKGNHEFKLFKQVTGSRSHGTPKPIGYCW